MVGKWHLGLCSQEYLPTSRGFHTFYGYYTGSEDYYLHSRASSTPPISQGYDLRDQEAVALAGNGTYSSHLFSSRAASIIEQQAASNRPMFLYLALQSVHSPLQVLYGHRSISFRPGAGGVREALPAHQEQGQEDVLRHGPGHGRGGERAMSSSHTSATRSGR